MTERQLPERPDLDQLRRQAKELRAAARSGDAAARDRFRRQGGDRAPLTRATALLVIAREFGFPSWPRLKADVEARTRALAERVEEFLRASVSAMTTLLRQHGIQPDEHNPPTAQAGR